ncbi:MAG: alpha-galactosidase [bacterium]
MPSLAFETFVIDDFNLAINMKDGTRVPLSFASAHILGDATEYLFSSDGVSARVTVSESAGGYTLYTNLQADPELWRTADRLVLFSAQVVGAEFTRVFTPRREIWLHAGIRNADGSALPDGPKKCWDAENMTAVYTPGAVALLAGVKMPARYPLEFAWRDGRLDISLLLADGLPARLELDNILLRGDLPLLESLEWYGAENRVRSCRPGQTNSMLAWNSWDWFQDSISQQSMLEALETISADPLLCDKVTAVVLDDGWAKLGDWKTPHEYFPDLGLMAATIRAAGYLPGIWYSPLRIMADSNWAKENPETILWGELGKHYDGKFTPEATRWVLDYSHPKVIEKIFTELHWLYQLGFRYFKTDFIQNPNSQFRRPNLYNPEVTTVEGVRQCMEAIRAAIGYDSYWLACGTEILPVAGLPDASRVSDDIRLHFSSLQLGMRNCAVYFWANGNLWLNDPDFLVVRCAGTSTTPHLREAQKLGIEEPGEEKSYQRCGVATGPVWSTEEARCWANFHIIYGGALSLGDIPSLLNDEGRAMTAMVLEHSMIGVPSIPLDLEENNLPTRWLRPAKNGWLLGLFNLNEEPATIALTPHELKRIGKISRATDIWSNAEVAWDNHTFSITLPAHTSRVLQLVV